MLTGPLLERLDHKKMASQSRMLKGLVPVCKLQRFGQMLAKTDGLIDLELNFCALKEGRTQIRGSAAVDVELICQNCMEPYSFALFCELHFKVVGSDTEFKKFEDDNEVIICEEKEICLADLIEDELIMSLPMIPRHEKSDCPSNDYSQVDFDVPVGEVKKTHRPFAGLAVALAKNEKPEN